MEADFADREKDVGTFPAVSPIWKICRAHGEGLFVLLVGIMVSRSHGVCGWDGISSQVGKTGTTPISMWEIQHGVGKACTV
jgi:hypothetical protein